MSKFLHFTILFALVLSACGGQAAPTVPPTQPPPPPSSTVQEPLPATTIVPIASAVPIFTETPNLPTLSPTNLPDCTNKAVFVADVSVPDNTNFAPGISYTKTWRIKNIGTCSWNSDYSILFFSGENSSAPDKSPLSSTAPGATLDISVDLTSPTKIGSATTNFVLHSPDGTLIPIDSGYLLYVIINVTNGVASSTSSSIVTQTSATSVSAGPTVSVPGGACAYTLDSAKVAETISAINSYRAQNGSPALTVNSLLTQAAQTHAADMACNNLFYHNGSDGSTAASRVAATGYTALNMTENVYGSYPPLTGQGVVAWWATDQLDIRHNENLLSTKHKEFGVAYAFYNNYGFYVVDFATSK